MKSIRYFVLLLLVVATAVSCGSKYKYETVKGDPMKTRIYTLDNGLKVYMSVNKEEPRVQTYIAVRVGSKNDPAETTGLAHYLEHLMFKGTQQFGTSDYEAEKPLLDKIEELYEVYRVTTDEEERAAIYAQIDSISYEASKIGIANEYDKMMSLIGATGTNAYTNNDCTVYVENIPANQMENWLHIESDRFKNAVIRGFHTELETVYEEKNISLSNDWQKVFTKMLNMLYPNHPYGTQTTLGTQEHLKNPSITNIKNYFAEWYVPNNMAICLSGDLDPDATIALIDKYFGDMKPNDNLPKAEYQPETPITSPQTAEILGNDQEFVVLAWRQNGEQIVEDQDKLTIIESLLSNGKVGLMDVNLNQPMKVLYSYGGNMALKEHGIFLVYGGAKEGQTLDEVRDLMLGQLELLRKGEFDETMFEAIVNNIKVMSMRQLESNNARANIAVHSFVNETPLSDFTDAIERIGKITKEQIVEFANKNLTDQNYVAIYKRTGKDDFLRMPKPPITPIETNREMQSEFVREISNSTVTPIEPVFVDFNRDMDKFNMSNGLEVLYKKNETNGLFDLAYVFETGRFSDPRYQFAFNYLDFLGMPDMTNEQIKREFYNMACAFYLSAGDERSFIELSGLGEKMDDAIVMLEKWVMNAQGDEELLAQLKQNILKERSDSKLNQNANSSALQRFAQYGADYIKHTTLTNEQVMAITSDELLGLLRDLFSREHRIIYYGPADKKTLTTSLEKNRLAPEQFLPFDNAVEFRSLITSAPKVYLAYYDAPQAIYTQISNDGTTFNPKYDTQVTIYNEYFGGGMSSIVFQEMREARGLAYTSWANLMTPRLAKDFYVFKAYIGTQNDKLPDAIDAFNEIIDNMPVNDNAFDLAKESILTRLRTERITKSGILWSYISAQDKGIDFDRRKNIYEGVQNITLQDVSDFQQEWIKARTYTYSVLGDLKALDMNKLKTMGEVTELNQEDIFGY